MKSFAFYGFFIAILGCLLTTSCQDTNELGKSSILTREEVSDLTILNPTSRLLIWENLSVENRFTIWQDKISQVTSQALKSEWESLFEELQSNFNFEMYVQATTGLENSIYLSDWIDRFQNVATEEERYMTIGSVFDYDAKTNTVIKQLSKLDVKYEDIQKEITNRNETHPGTDKNCDCRWGSCPGQEYECKPWQTTECTQTGEGCGFLLLQDCTHFCVNCFAWNCLQY